MRQFYAARWWRPLLAGAIILTYCLGCAVNWAREAEYYAHAPRTIVVMPPANLTNNLNAVNLCLATLVKPLILRGYYVFPIELTAAILKQEGIDEGMAWQIPPQRLRQYFGADAVLYPTIHRWDTTYVVLESHVIVAMSYRLVDTSSGEPIWENQASKVHQSSMVLSRNLLASLVTTAISAAATAAFSDYVELATQTHREGFAALPPGYCHPDYARIQHDIEAWRASHK